MNYTLDYFIEKFEAIPEDKWTTNEFADEQGRCCAFGHCGMRQGLFSDEGEALFEMVPDGIPDINDNRGGWYDKYGSTPKQ
ncbi:hypothetical protein [Pedobacter faecalis]|uniref:hypothetical protein n=1 Tax=Pedobacter faecalis TaxID=3041495 RepID=UPI00254AC142|nr:hypothetical protein [Pedobacter sp. ELA7]